MPVNVVGGGLDEFRGRGERTCEPQPQANVWPMARRESAPRDWAKMDISACFRHETVPLNARDCLNLWLHLSLTLIGVAWQSVAFAMQIMCRPFRARTSKAGCPGLQPGLSWAGLSALGPLRLFRYNSAATSASMRILVVEDEADLLRSVAKALREEGYAVDTAVDGEEGLFSAENNDYDAIVLDVMMPKLDGWEMLARLRRTKKTPVLMLTARDQSRDRVRGLDTGADDYVVKPFDLPELFARLRALIRRSAGQTRNVIEIGDVSLDIAARRVTRASEIISLTAREYALLEYLALHRGELVTRTALYEHLFDENDSTMSNLLDVHVSNLRKKLGAEFISTRRGHGYCIE